MENVAADLVQDMERKTMARAAVAFAVAQNAPAGPDGWADMYRARMGGKYLDLAMKAAVAPLDTASGLAPANPLIRAFAEAVQREDVLGALRRRGAISLPPNAYGTFQTGGAIAFWVGEDLPKPLTSLSFTGASLAAKKLAAVTTLSRELLYLTDTRAQDIATRALISATAAATDSALLDATAGSTSRPAGLLNGIGATVLSGDLAAQAGLLLNALSGGAAERPTLIVSFGTALRLQASIRDLREIGIEVVVSAAATNRVIAIDATGLLLVDEGASIDISRNASLVFDDAPPNPDVAATVHVSTFQRNLVAVKVERFLNWRARPDAIAWGTIV